MATGVPPNATALAAANAAAHAKWIALCLVVVGFALRCRGYLDAWPNPDEGAYLAIATSTSWSAFSAEIAHHTHPPGIYLLHRLLAQLGEALGFVDAFGPSLAWLRLPSLLGGSAAIYGVFLLGSEMGREAGRETSSGARDRAGRETGLLAAALLAVSPVAVVLSQVLRPYGVLAAALAFGTAALLRYARHGERTALATGSLCIGVACFVHYSTFLVLPAASWIVLRRALADLSRGTSPVAPIGALLLWAGIAGALAASHVVPRLLGEPIHRGAQASWLADSFHASPLSALLALPGLFQLGAGSLLGFAALACCAAGFARLARARDWDTVVLSGGTVLIAMTASWLGLYPFGASRHGFYLVILLAPVTALGVHRLLVGRGQPRALATAALVALVAVSAAIGTAHPPAVRLDERLATRSDFAPALAALERARNEGGLWLLDRQTYRFLTPYFGRAGEARERSAERASVFTWFDWGTARVVVAQPWRIRTGTDSVERANHVFGALLRASRVPAVEASRYRRGLLILGGWNLRTEGSVGGTPLVIEPIDWVAYIARIQPLAHAQRASAR